ncbi:non-homologous end joining protein Ku [Terracidiphilus gabretensis]|uniref:non-homologous end joining protein Ku n=1 Tax=Terracidiphilus gabretensis TaxID=1577687 RepID=UPI00071BB697|nr:Ku protein [Terracidiphilus gabretensis]
MARAFWSGQLRISLVSFGINLVPASESKSEIRFHQLDRRSGERIRHQKVSAVDEEAVEKDDIVKGYEYRKGKYIQLEPAEIAQVRIASRHTIELEQFVKTSEIDPAYYEKPYFVLPENAAQEEAFAVVRAALEDTKEAGLGKIALNGRERLVAVCVPNDPKLRGLMAYTLRFSTELRNAADYFKDMAKHAVDSDQLSLAKELIQRKSASFEPDKFTDNYEAALRELIDAKLKHVAVPVDEPRESRGKVINLMDALRRSVGEHGKGKKPIVRADGNASKSRTGKQTLRLMPARSQRVDKRRKSA